MTKIVHRTHDVVKKVLQGYSMESMYRSVLYYVEVWPITDDDSDTLVALDNALFETKEWQDLYKPYEPNEDRTHEDEQLFVEKLSRIMLTVALDILENRVPRCSTEECERGLKKWISRREYPGTTLHSIVHSGAYVADEDAMLEAMCVWEKDIIPKYDDDPDFLYYWEKDKEHEDVLIILQRALKRWQENVT